LITGRFIGVIFIISNLVIILNQGRENPKVTS
jgi:hypothetical protein